VFGLPHDPAIRENGTMYSFSASNYRGLGRLELKPHVGINLLVGPNGAGKTTAISVPVLLRFLFKRGFAEMLQTAGGAYSFRNFRSKDEFVRIAVGWKDYQWEVEFPFKGAGVDPNFGERLTVGDKVWLRREPFAPFSEITWDGKVQKWGNVAEASFGGVGLKAVIGLGFASAEVVEFAGHLEQFIAYPPLSEESVDSMTQVNADTILEVDGTNLANVLRNWHGSSKLRGNYQFVIEACRQAFKGEFQDLEFEPSSQAVAMQTIVPGVKDGIPMFATASGIRLALMRLAAVAGVPEGTYVGLDEIENGMHPFALREVVDAIRGLARQRNLTVCLASQSPTLINCFRDEPDHVLVMERDFDPTPQPLTTLHDRDWLREYTLGDLYDLGQFGIQRGERHPNGHG
jgi:predicted ATPase